MKGRTFLAYAVAVSLVEQAVLLAVTLWLLPSVDIHVPGWLIATIAVVLAVQSVILTRVNLRTLDQRPIFSPDPGTHARTVSTLDPVGYVRAGNELWVAVSEGRRIERGEAVVVRRREGMRLVVSRSDTENGAE